MINKVILIGNLGSRPEQKILDSGSKVSRISLATNESYKDKNDEWQQKTQWHNVIAWNALSEKAEKLRKGNKIYVEGKISTRSYDASGETKYVTEIIASKIIILEKIENESSLKSEQEKSFESAIGEPKKLGDIDQPTTKGKQEALDLTDDLPF